MPGTGGLIALEGPDQSAIDAIQEQLYSWLQGQGVAVERAQMPTRGPIGLVLRIEAQDRLHLDPASLALLWTADRLDLLGRPEGLRAWLAAGRAVLCTHYRLRGYAALWEATGQTGVDPRWLAQIDAPCATPDLTLYLAPDAAHPAYRHALETLPSAGGRVVRLAGGRSPEETARACETHVAAALGL